MALAMLTLALLALRPQPHARAAASPSRVLPPVVCVAKFTSPAPLDGALPSDICGPWELRSTLSGVESLWVELSSDGALGCSAKVGRGQNWTAVRKGEEWVVSFTLLDKLKRPLTFQGNLGSNEFQSLTIAGKVFVPPRGARDVRAKMVQVGEFSGHKLD
ncbi:hypothetical protein AB1Y20_005801 [Prymnesium parvum]|uniref:Plastid lipid-associated protein/fibrillin conserved domain-containing protein n=1 Tax=Prymnesium parvum TaxID=97485 RepID=A0AB34J1E8_PRYPA